MPIIRIEALLNDQVDIPAMLQSVCAVAATAFDRDPAHFWVTFRSIEPGCYLEGGRIRGAADTQQVSPLVTVSARTGRSQEQIDRLLREVARAVGEYLGLDPDLVFIEYHELFPGRAYTGGQVI